jgi:hypothetical protein
LPEAPDGKIRKNTERHEKGREEKASQVKEKEEKRLEE